MGSRPTTPVTRMRGRQSHVEMPTIRRLAADEWCGYREIRLRALTDSPDAFGSTLAVERVRPDAHWSERLSTGVASDWNYPLVAVVAGELVGVVWGRIDPDIPQTAHIYQMWVEPRCRGMGIGSMLLREVVAWARKAGAKRAVLSVTCGDTPARRLYDRVGFAPVDDPKPIRAGSALLSQTMTLTL
ncbi:MAG: GNAT family N-acetyltransferase [Gemmatimonas sp.]|nr:GNAT family N-acetyltransferase [Gemmatimonas sp.]